MKDAFKKKFIKSINRRFKNIKLNLNYIYFDEIETVLDLLKKTSELCDPSKLYYDCNFKKKKCKKMKHCEWTKSARKKCAFNQNIRGKKYQVLPYLIYYNELIGNRGENTGLVVCVFNYIQAKKDNVGLSNINFNSKYIIKYNLLYKNDNFVLEIKDDIPINVDLSNHMGKKLIKSINYDKDKNRLYLIGDDEYLLRHIDSFRKKCVKHINRRNKDPLIAKSPNQNTEPFFQQLIQRLKKKKEMKRTRKKKREQDKSVPDWSEPKFFKSFKKYKTQNEPENDIRNLPELSILIKEQEEHNKLNAFINSHKNDNPKKLSKKNLSLLNTINTNVRLASEEEHNKLNAFINSHKNDNPKKLSKKNLSLLNTINTKDKNKTSKETKKERTEREQEEDNTTKQMLNFGSNIPHNRLESNDSGLPELEGEPFKAKIPEKKQKMREKEQKQKKENDWGNTSNFSGKTQNKTNKPPENDKDINNLFQGLSKVSTKLFPNVNIKATSQKSEIEPQNNIPRRLSRISNNQLELEPIPNVKIIQNNTITSNISLEAKVSELRNNKWEKIKPIGGKCLVEINNDKEPTLKIIQSISKRSLVNEFRYGYKINKNDKIQKIKEKSLLLTLNTGNNTIIFNFVFKNDKDSNIFLEQFNISRGSRGSISRGSRGSISRGSISRGSRGSISRGSRGSISRGSRGSISRGSISRGSRGSISRGSRGSISRGSRGSISRGSISNDFEMINVQNANNWSERVLDYKDKPRNQTPDLKKKGKTKKKTLFSRFWTSKKSTKSKKKNNTDNNLKIQLSTLEGIRDKLKLENGERQKSLNKTNNAIEKLAVQYERTTQKDLIKQHIRSKMKMKKNLQNLIKKTDKILNLTEQKIDNFFENKRLNNAIVSDEEIARLTKLNF